MTPDEVIFLETQASQHGKSEQSWLSMTTAHDEDDRWSSVEEHLLDKSQKAEHSFRRWKYFSK